MSFFNSHDAKFVGLVRPHNFTEINPKLRAKEPTPSASKKSISADSRQSSMKRAAKKKKLQDQLLYSTFINNREKTVNLTEKPLSGQCLNGNQKTLKFSGNKQQYQMDNVYDERHE